MPAMTPYAGATRIKLLCWMLAFRTTLSSLLLVLTALSSGEHRHIASFSTVELAVQQNVLWIQV